MSLLVILIVSTLTWALVDAVYKGREKTNQALLRSLIRSVRWNLKSILRVLMKRWPST